ncbi:MAG TPA: hypothetical protein VNP20_17900 [Nocardioidaceae bacterium]|nr:hypothetical protein [Nocardioidaceae bacterium]
MGGNDEFVSRIWLAPIPATVCFLLVALAIGGSTPLGLGSGFFLYIAVAAGAASLVRWYWARPDIGDSDRVIALRWIGLVQIVVALTLTTALMVTGATQSAVIIALVAISLVGSAWPWGWTLDRARRNRVRSYESTYLVLSLIAGGLLAGVAAMYLFGVFPSGLSPSDVQTLAGLLLAGALSQFIEAWDERRRPRRPRTPETHQVR